MLQWLVMRVLENRIIRSKIQLAQSGLFNILTLSWHSIVFSKPSRGRREPMKMILEEVYQFSKQPADTVIAHLQFYLRHEIPHYELMYRLFQINR